MLVKECFGGGVFVVVLSSWPKRLEMFLLQLNFKVGKERFTLNFHIGKERGKEAISNPFEHLRWSFFAKIVCCF